MGDDIIGYAMQGRAESSAILVALAIGIFGILMLYTQSYIQLLSASWWILTISYFIILALTIQGFRSWAWHQYYLEYYQELFQKKSDNAEWQNHKTIMDEIEKARKNSWMLRNLVIPKYPSEIIKLNIAMQLLIIVTLAMGLILWLFIAFHCGIGDPINPVCSFPEPQPTS